MFLAVAIAACAAAAAVLLGTAQLDLSGPSAIERDGLAPGHPAPRWSLPDSSGTLRQSPPAAPLQLVIFADHSLRSFPSVVSGLRDLLAADPVLEVILLLRGPNDLAGPLLSLLGLDLPVVTGTPGLYARYNVRVGPFAIFVDAAGQVRASSLVNHDWQVAKLRQLAGLPPAGPLPPAVRRLRRPPGRARAAV
jgi:hypothetical protein